MTGESLNGGFAVKLQIVDYRGLTLPGFHHDIIPNGVIPCRRSAAGGGEPMQARMGNAFK